MKTTGFQDIIVTPILFLIIMLVCQRRAKEKYGTSVMYEHFMNGLLMRMIGGGLSALITLYVFGKGDTLLYFNHGTYIGQLFRNNLFHNWIVFFPEFFHDEIINIPDFYSFMLQKQNAYMVSRISAFLGTFLFDSFFSVGIIFSVFSFIGSWKLYKVFLHYAPGQNKQIAIAALYMPSVIIWGTGITKDALTFGSLGVLVYCFHAVFSKGVLKFKYFLYAFLAIYLIGVVKPYILMALLPSLVFFQVNNVSTHIKSTFLKTTIFPLLLFFVVVGSFSVLSVLNTTFTAYNLDNMEDKLEGFQRYHTRRSEEAGGSGYTLGSGGTSPAELLIKFPLAVNVTLFRPYIWEARKPLVFLSALESLFVLVITIQTFRRIGIGGTFSLFLKDPFISFCFVFAIVFAFAVGISSYNFGALMRFKIPCLPFYMMALYMSRQKFASNNPY